MKFKKAILPFIVLFLVGSISFMATAKAVAFPNLPATTVTLTSILHDTLFAGPSPFDTWYFDNILSGVPAGFDVSDGTYTPSWCVDRTGMSIPSGDLIYLYSSLSLPANPELHVQDWNRINYILNHIDPSATTADIQQAIWAFVPPPAVADPTPTLISQQMIGNATAYGGSFVPGPGEFVAVVCEPTAWETENLQITIIVLQIPGTGGPGLTPGFWKHNVGVYLGLKNGNYSDPINSPFVTKDTMGEWLDAGWTDAQLLALFNDMNTQGGGALGAATRNNAANVFNAAAGLTPL